ncbi:MULTISPECIES: septal ring lytic transglycosylase RlpA family protein [unclassified Aureimonas]|uniref:septal ring lytic transglycosylase RlpA family protein n=1 Tax=Aureimonas sp. Leaf460 TaxID=1736384 RepID=UPI001FCDF6AA|nr:MULTISPECIES: septal ring lytic transglycosylase RlpA family protein [unclassified Aureimonas]
MIAKPAEAAALCGGASWYSLRSRTASGEMMNPSAMTAAHKTLKLGTKVKVTNLRNGRSVVVRINDRGPFIKGRVIDLSKGAAGRLGFIDSGHTQVEVEPLDGKAYKGCA